MIAESRLAVGWDAGPSDVAQRIHARPTPSDVAHHIHARPKLSGTVGEAVPALAGRGLHQQA